MGIAVFPAPAAGGKTAFRLTLTSGSSWTVPAGVTYVNVLLYGGGGAGGGAGTNVYAQSGNPGQVIASTLNTTPGASINYAIGAGGTAATAGAAGGNGGTTTFTGATSATGGLGGATHNGAFSAGTQAGVQNNGSQGTAIASATPAAGGAGKIDIEYWA
jgi:hypothetical protein